MCVNECFNACRGARLDLFGEDLAGLGIRDPRWRLALQAIFLRVGEGLCHVCVVRSMAGAIQAIVLVCRSLAHASARQVGRLGFRRAW
jgi:hypothetical protein